MTMNLLDGIRRAAAMAAIVAPLICGLTPGFAQAQDSSGCILDHCADRRALPQSETQPARPRGPSVPGDFDFYVLALSWSPGFCETGGAEKARSQCESGANLGFVVHGLWPQYERGYPSDCGPAGRTPSRIALQSVDGIYPDERLARYEWRKHGTCSGKSPTDYFADVRRAREQIAIPQPFMDAREEQSWAPIDIQRAFIAANPRLRPGMISVECVHNVLEEVRICMSKDLREFVACPQVSRQGCHFGTISVPPIR